MKESNDLEKSLDKFLSDDDKKCDCPEGCQKCTPKAKTETNKIASKDIVERIDKTLVLEDGRQLLI